MTAAVRSPRAVLGALVVVAAPAWAAVAAVRARSGLVPPADPWLVTALVLLGAWLALGALAADARARVNARALRRHPDLPIVLDAVAMRDDPAGLRDDPTGPAGAAPGSTLPHRNPVATWWPFVAAAALALALVLSLRTYAAADDTLARSGVRTTGRVTASGWAYAGRGGRPVATVEYAYAGRPTSAVVAAPAPGVTPPGTRLSLLVDADRPDHVRVEDVPATTSTLEWWKTLALLGALGLLGYGVRGLLAARAWRATAARWQDAVVQAVPSGRRTAVLVTTVQVQAVASARGEVPTGDVRVLAGPGRSLLVQGDGDPVQVRLPATVAAGRRLLTALR